MFSRLDKLTTLATMTRIRHVYKIMCPRYVLRFALSHPPLRPDKTQLTATLLYLYFLFSNSGRSRTPPDLLFDSPLVGPKPQQAYSQDPSSLTGPALVTESASDKAVVLSRHHNHSNTSLVPYPPAAEFNHHVPMADPPRVPRHGNNERPMGGAERVYEAMKQHEDYKPGTVFETSEVLAGGMQTQGNFVTGKPDAPYRSHFFGHTTVSGFNIQGDMPPEIALELAKLNAPQQQQHQLRHHQQDQVGGATPPEPPRYRIIGGEKIPLPTNVPTSTGRGHTLR